MVSVEIPTSLEIKLKHVSDNWLKKGVNLAGDEPFNFKDYAKLFKNPPAKE